MKNPNQLLELLLVGLAKPLDKLGEGWKTILGASLVTIILIVRQMEWIDNDTTEWLLMAAGILTGVGLLHKAGRNNIGTS